MPPSTWIKICGIRDAETARAVADAGADAIGINFHPPSPRCVSDADTAAAIVASIPESLLAVALFVNAGEDEIARLHAHVRFGAIQLHGDESPADLERIQNRLPDLKLIWARRVTPVDVERLGDEFDECRDRGVALFACLLDAKVEGIYGGTGQALPWRDVARQYRRGDWPPLILAGGLTPDNVAQGVRIVRPFGVDVAGGVEASRGVKDLQRVRAFVEAVRGADHPQAR